MYLREAFPLQTSLAGADADALPAFCQRALTDALALGLDTEAAVQSFADHMVLLGVGFAHNPLYAALCEPLFDPALVSPVQRMDLLYDGVWPYLETTRGPDGGNLVRALVRLRTRMSHGQQAWTTHRGELLNSLHQMFPEQAGAHPGERLGDFCDRALHRAEQAALEPEAARALFVHVAFIAGLDCLGDPLFRGAVLPPVTALAQSADPRRRGWLFGSAVAAYLDQLLQLLRAATGGPEG